MAGYEWVGRFGAELRNLTPEEMRDREVQQILEYRKHEKEIRAEHARGMACAKREPTEEDA